jgi:hypothetical protein
MPLLSELLIQIHLGFVPTEADSTILQKGSLTQTESYIGDGYPIPSVARRRLPLWP